MRAWSEMPDNEDPMTDEDLMTGRAAVVRWNEPAASSCLVCGAISGERTAAGYMLLAAPDHEWGFLIGPSGPCTAFEY